MPHPDVAVTAPSPTNAEVAVRILFIHEVNYSNKVIFEMHEFPELLALRGHDVSFFHYPESPEIAVRRLRTVRERIAGRVHKDASLTLITPPTLGGGPLERYIAPVLNLPALRREIVKGDYDVVFLYAVPTTGWQAVSIARRAGVPVVFRALDVSHKIRASIVAPLIRAAEKYIYRRATVLSANNPAMLDYCVELSGRTGPSVVNLPPINLSHFGSSVDADLHASLGLTAENRVVLYMGSFFGFSGLDVVLRDMAVEFADHPQLRLVLVGGGELDDELRSLARELRVEDRVIFTGLVSYATLPQYLKLADVAINPFRLELLTHVALPHKVLQYMAAGVPAVSTSLRGLRGVLGDDAGVTWADGPKDVARIATALATGERSVLAGLIELQKARVAELFSESAAVDSLEDTLQSVG